MKIMFASFRYGKDVDGWLKLSIDGKPPRQGHYLVVDWLAHGHRIRDVDRNSVGAITDVIMDNNWDRMCELLDDLHQLGVEKILMCCWCDRDADACPADFIGAYIAGHCGDLDFPVEVEYMNGK